MERRMAESDGKCDAEAARHNTYGLVGISVIISLGLTILGFILT